MIEKMKKITLIVSEKEREKFVSILRRAGVVHVHNVEDPTSHETTFVEDKILKIEHMLSELAPFEGETKAKQEASFGERDILQETVIVADLIAERNELLEKTERARENIKWFDDWGEFDPEDVKSLFEKGADLRLYRISSKKFKELKAGEKHILKKQKGEVFFFTVSLDEEVLPAEPATLPEKSAAAFREEEKDLHERIKELEGKLEEKSGHIDKIKEQKEKLLRELSFLGVKCGMGEEDRFSYLQGYCPQKKEEKIVKLAGEHGLGYIVEEPSEEDEVPTLITNPKWVRIIDPVFQFMNTLPGYSEFDISFVFLVFFSVFFAMLIGDAGYGTIFVLITFLARRKFPKAPFEPFFLMYLLGGATMVWGAITGTWFGAEQIAQIPVFKKMVIQDISSFAGGNQNTIIYMCFILGAIHLTIAHVMRAVRAINSPKALGDVGWIAIVWGMFFAAGKFVIGKEFPAFAGYFFIAGILLVLLFENFQKNIFKGMATTLTNLPLAVIGSFSDVVSYLRLFAVGYASVVLASTFNTMAIGDGINGVVSGLIAAVILFLGHTLNIVLGMMAIVVHGIRLNMLEFSGHLGMQWSGKKYEPFSE